VKRFIAILVLLSGVLLRGAFAQEVDVPSLIDALSAHQDPRVAAALARIEGTDRRLLALRGYLRAGTGLVQRWSWTAGQIAAFGSSPENQAIQAAIARVRQAFVAANPGFDLWVNPEVRSLDVQLNNWNSNQSVARAAAGLSIAFESWVNTAAIRAMPAADARRAAEQFLVGFVPKPIPTLAVPGLSPHGQMRAIDFQIRKDGKTIAGPRSATIASEWDGAGWTRKLNDAVRVGSSHFHGPLESPREPWHYTYSP